MSRFGTLETSYETQLLTLVPTALAYAKKVPADAIFTHAPAAYPAALICVERAKVLETSPHNAGHMLTRWRVPVWILVYGASDGTEIGDARGAAWTAVDAVVDAFVAFVPSGLSNTSVWPTEPEDITPVEVSTGKYGILVPFHVDIQWLT